MGIIREYNASIARDAIVLNLGDLAAQGQRLREIATQEARAIIDAAGVRRKELLETASADGYAKGHALGLEQGTAQGLAKGMEEAVAAAARSGEQVLKAWTEALESFERQRESLLVQAREDVLRIALLFAQRIVGRVVAVDDQVAVRQLERIIPMVLRPSRLTIRVHPAEVPTVNAVLPGLIQRFENARDTHVEPDSTLQQGSCVLSSANGSVIDAGIATQIADLAAALLPGDSGVAGGATP